MPAPTRFDLKTLRPVEVKCLLVLCFLLKVLTLAFALLLSRVSKIIPVFADSTNRQ